MKRTKMKREGHKGRLTTLMTNAYHIADKGKDEKKHTCCERTLALCVGSNTEACAHARLLTL